MYFLSEQFSIYMQLEFNLKISESDVVEESVFLKKEEIDNELINQNLLNLFDDEVRLDMCEYNFKNEEWLIAVAHDVTSDEPLFLICCRNNKVIRTQIY